LLDLLSFFSCLYLSLKSGKLSFLFAFIHLHHLLPDTAQRSSPTPHFPYAQLKSKQSPIKGSKTFSSAIMSSSGARSYTLQPPVIHQQDQQSSDSDSYRSRNSSEYNSGSEMSRSSSNAHARGRPAGETERLRVPDNGMLCHSPLPFRFTNQIYVADRKYIEVTENRTSKKPVKIIDHGESKGHYDPAEPTLLPKRRDTRRRVPRSPLIEHDNRQSI
jgi:hypothetical protein